jgi:hypothetical protein
MDTNTTTTTDNQALPTKRKVPTLAEREETVTKNFSGFRIRLSRDTVGKKKLSNRVTITVPDSRSESTIKMTFREARALQSFLNNHLPIK